MEEDTDTVVMAGMLIIYGLIVSVIIISFNGDLTIEKGLKQLGGGFAVGLSGLFSGFAMGHIGGGNRPCVEILLNIFARLLLYIKAPIY